MLVFHPSLYDCVRKMVHASVGVAHINGLYPARPHIPVIDSFSYVIDILFINTHRPEEASESCCFHVILVPLHNILFAGLTEDLCSAPLP